MALKRKKRRKKQNILEYFRVGVVLGIICILAAFALSYTYSITLARIEEQKGKNMIRALPQVLPWAVGFSSEKELNNLRYFVGYKDDEIIGYAVRGEIQGYQSEIKYMLGLNTDGIIEGLTVLGHGETPGLGARIIEIQNDQTLIGFIKNVLQNTDSSSPKVTEPWFPALFKGKSYTVLSLGTESGDGIAAITGATITSRSIVEGVKEQSKQLFELLRKEENADN